MRISIAKHNYMYIETGPTNATDFFKLFGVFFNPLELTFLPSYIYFQIVVTTMLNLHRFAEPIFYIKRYLFIYRLVELVEL